MNALNEIVAVITDLGLKNTGGSVTNNVELICASLIEKGYIPPKTIFIEHYERSDFQQATFDKVILHGNRETEWNFVSESDVIMLTQCELNEFITPTISNVRILSEIEKLRAPVDPLIDFPYQQSTEIINRRFEIETNKISKQSLRTFF